MILTITNKSNDSQFPVCHQTTKYLLQDRSDSSVTGKKGLPINDRYIEMSLATSIELQNTCNFLNGFGHQLRI